MCRGFRGHYFIVDSEGNAVCSCGATRKLITNYFYTPKRLAGRRIVASMPKGYNDGLGEIKSQVRERHNKRRA